MTVRELMELLARENPDREVIVSSDADPVQLPVRVNEEDDHGTDTLFVRIYTETGEEE